MVSGSPSSPSPFSLPLVCLSLPQPLSFLTPSYDFLSRVFSYLYPPVVPLQPPRDAQCLSFLRPSSLSHISSTPRPPSYALRLSPCTLHPPSCSLLPPFCTLHPNCYALRPSPSPHFPLTDTLTTPLPTKHPPPPTFPPERVSPTLINMSKFVTAAKSVWRSRVRVRLPRVSVAPSVRAFIWFWI